jgi:6-phosphogluconolactonase/glucosamine-6-phosphate isomerase/deaminase
VPGDAHATGHQRVTPSFFLVTGAAKAETLQAVLEGPGGHYPAQHIRPTAGQITWLLDAAAASQLNRPTQ